ncbi:ras-related protein Rab-7a-like [Drosophila sulfurigaster albostrigata]|uniref:ras-related protein Rab-7a-like n=1 Tax=Drosophila sulfurigaster albostrigata TaxID=89887 RepID=UPI002D21A069|nr:ras-related protein Rab-7a-like [Drosophila sulfurigaster albostrigata]
MSRPIERMLNIVLLGDDSVGKTSLIYRYINEENSGKCETWNGTDLFTKEVILNDSLVSLKIWEWGHEEFINTSTASSRRIDCCIFVFDVTSRKSFESLNSWREKFFFAANENNSNEFPVAVVGTKIDLENERKVSKQEAQDWCKSFSIPYFECSSKDDINVQQVFEAMTAKLVDTHKL